MSYILQAQRRDEAAIDPDAAAQLVVAEDRQGRRRWVLWLIAVALLANVLIIGYLFGPWSGAESGPRASGKLSNPKATRELVVKPRERTGPTQPSTAARPSRNPPTQAPVARRIAPEQPSTSASGNSSQASNPAASGSSKGRVLSPEEAAQLNIGLPTEPATSSVAAPTANTGPAAQDAPALASTPEPEPEPEPQAKAPASSAKKPIKLADLSPEDRAEFPELEFSTHVFADDPALRAVVVNSRRLSEGESIGEMVLRAVTEDGIIVDYRGQRVAVSVMDTWK